MRAQRREHSGESTAARAQRREHSGESRAARAQRRGHSGEGTAARAQRRGQSGEGTAARAQRREHSGESTAARAQRRESRSVASHLGSSGEPLQGHPAPHQTGEGCVAVRQGFGARDIRVARHEIIERPLWPSRRPLTRRCLAPARPASSFDPPHRPELLLCSDVAVSDRIVAHHVRVCAAAPCGWAGVRWRALHGAVNQSSSGGCRRPAFTSSSRGGGTQCSFGGARR